MQKVYIAYSDSGHGWAKVPMRELYRLGIVDRITPYSYRRGDYAYLEEDCDLTTFVKAKDERGEPVEFRTRYSEYSRIRSYSGFYK